MKCTRDRMKAELLAEAEVVVDKLLDWNDNTPAPTLIQLEEVVLKLGQELSQRMAEVVLRDQEATQPVPGPLCPTCQQETHYKGMKEVTVESRLGTLHLERSYHYCQHCRSGLFPPWMSSSSFGRSIGVRGLPSRRSG